MPLAFVTSQLAVLEISCLACITSHLAALDNSCLWHLKLEISLRSTFHAYGIRNFNSRCARYLMPTAFGTSLNALLTYFHYNLTSPLDSATHFNYNIQFSSKSFSKACWQNNGKQLMAVKISVFEEIRGHHWTNRPIFTIYTNFQVNRSIFAK